MFNLKFLGGLLLLPCIVNTAESVSLPIKHHQYPSDEGQKVIDNQGTLIHVVT